MCESVLVVIVYKSVSVLWHLYAGEDASEGAVVQRKGRFKVTSAELGPKVYMQNMCITIRARFGYPLGKL